MSNLKNLIIPLIQIIIITYSGTFSWERIAILLIVIIFIALFHDY